MTLPGAVEDLLRPDPVRRFRRLLDDHSFNRTRRFAFTLLLLLWSGSACVFGEPALTNAVDTFDAAWGIIEKTHFDRGFNGVDWNRVRDELRPKAAAALSKAGLDAIIQDMLDRLGQSHMEIIPAQGEKARGSRLRKAPLSPDEDRPSDAATTGLHVRFLAGELVVVRVDSGSAGSKGGVHPGWIITRIDETESSEIAPVTAEFSRTGYVNAWAEAVRLLKGPAGSRVRIHFLGAHNRSRSLDLLRQAPRGEPARFGNLPTFFTDFDSEVIKAAEGKRVGLIRFNIWMMPIARQFSLAMDRLRGCDGIVIDLRGNVGGVAGLVMGVAGHFLADAVSLGTMKTRDGELQFMGNPRKVNLAGERVEPFAGPVAILVDAVSLSASEIFAGGMQSIGRARIFGERTGGMALPASFDRLPNGDLLIHALGDFVTPSGVRLEGHGVLPDEEVPLSREDLLADRDAPLRAALRWIAHGGHRRNPEKATALRNDKSL